MFFNFCFSRGVRRSSHSAVHRSITLYHFAKRKLNSHENKQQKKGEFFMQCPSDKLRPHVYLG
jgi:hypothetical protein